MFQYGIGFNAKMPTKLWKKRRKVSGFLVDETLIKVGRELVWLWIAIEPIEKVILDIRISFERSIYLLLNGSSELIRKYGKYPVSTDDDDDNDNDNDNDGTGYPSKHVNF
jgi:hypothetical protein